MIALACGEVAEGRWDSEFIVDIFEGSGGTSTNMNFNEVIARRAQQIGGDKVPVHPNDPVNPWQSTNDVYPAAMEIAVHRLLLPLVDELQQLRQAFAKHRRGMAEVLHLGRTCMQDAQPMMLGQKFGGYAELTARRPKN
ncbi:lyase family enzyme [Roseateles toxinivorans]|uniref:Lyase family enzyme n=1 Tax=Roseateles toxinivorans TaxID=270368 RepID=A0A4R6QTH8_9BURK|nr:lyase family protein [Roseateles toxinivorans]TDP74536.1 lyase family enzyme [Roseateles toxinivorans]